VDALLLALLLGLGLDQGDRSQRLVRTLGPDALIPVTVIALIGATVSALFGGLVAPYLTGPAGLLFFAIALVLGAVGLVIPVGKTAPEAPPPSGRALLYGRLLLHRFADRSSFVLVGIAAMTGSVWATALGGTLGGLAALLPPLLGGAAYERAVPLRVIRPLLGVPLLIAGFGCALSALGLL